MKQLKSCPFCGGEAEIYEFKRARTIPVGVLTNKCISEPLPSKYLVRCKNKGECNGNAPSTKFFDEKQDAIEAWNRRAEQGYLLRLACNVGDTVYIKGIALDVSFIHVEEEVTYCVQFECDDCGDCPFYEEEVSWEGEYSCRTNGYIEFKEADIGKTVFLTFEEMKAALKEG